MQLYTKKSLFESADGSSVVLSLLFAVGLTIGNIGLNGKSAATWQHSQFDLKKTLTWIVNKNQPCP